MIDFRFSSLAPLTNLYSRTAEPIRRLAEPETIRPQVRNQRVWARLRQSPAEVIEELFAEAQRRDPQHERTWIVLVDGQEAQLGEVEAAMARHRADTVVIQDFVHALEYRWKAAYCFHAEGTCEAEAWVMEHALALLKGQVSDVAAGMRRSATRKALSPEAREPVDQCADSLLQNKARFAYVTALANGGPIATGIIEGACRHRVKDRMDLTGARWSVEGAEAVLRLRALRASGDFDDYRAFTGATSASATMFRHRKMMAFKRLCDSHESVAEESRTLLLLNRAGSTHSQRPGRTPISNEPAHFRLLKIPAGCSSID